ncbi:hypothetical protein D3C76_1325340 [compost metagenome]
MYIGHPERKNVVPAPVLVTRWCQIVVAQLGTVVFIRVWHKSCSSQERHPDVVICFLAKVAERAFAGSRPDFSFLYTKDLHIVYDLTILGDGEQKNGWHDDRYQRRVARATGHLFH